MKEKQSVWPRLLAPELQGGINSESRKALLKKNTSSNFACGSFKKKKFATGGMEGLPVPISDNGIEEEQQPQEQQESNDNQEQQQGEPIAGRYTGDDNGVVHPLQESDAQLHKGEFVISAPMVNVLGGKEGVEKLLVKEAENRINSVSGGSISGDMESYEDNVGSSNAIRPISEEVQGSPEQEEQDFEEATEENAYSLGSWISKKAKKVGNVIYSGIKTAGNKIEDAAKSVGGSFKGAVDAIDNGKSLSAVGDAFASGADNYNPKNPVSSPIQPTTTTTPEPLSTTTPLPAPNSQAYQMMISKGFTDWNELEDAGKKGFTTKEQYDFAKKNNLASITELTDYQKKQGDSDLQSAATAGGFENIDQYNEAQKGGFADYKTYQDAKTVGFATLEEAMKARKAGFSDKATMDKAISLGYATMSAYKNDPSYIEHGDGITKENNIVTTLPPIDTTVSDAERKKIEDDAKASQAALLQSQAMDRMASQANGNNPYLQRIVEEALQKNAGDTVAARQALEAQLAQQGITGTTAAGMMNAFDANASQNKIGLEGDLAKQIMSDAITSNKELAVLATGQNQFEQNYSLSVDNYSDAQNWKKLSVMLDTGVPADQVQMYMKDTFGLSVDMSGLKTKQQASDFAESSSFIATAMKQAVNGGNGSVFEGLSDPTKLQQALDYTKNSMPQVHSQLLKAFASSGGVGDENSTAFKNFAGTMLGEMRTVNDPVMPLVNSFSLDSLKGIIGDDFVADTFEYGGYKGKEAIKKALVNVVINKGLSKDATTGDITTDTSGTAWDVFKTVSVQGAIHATGIDKEPLWTIKKYMGKDYIKTPDGVRLATETDGKEFRTDKGENLPSGETVKKGDNVYTSNGDGTFTTTPIKDITYDKADPFSSQSEDYLKYVAGGNYNSKAGKELVDAQVSWLKSNVGVSTSVNKLSGKKKGDPVYDKLLADSNDFSTITSKTYDYSWPGVEYQFNGVSELGQYFKKDDVLYYIPKQTPVVGDEDGFSESTSLNVYNVSNGTKTIIRSWGGNITFDPTVSAGEEQGIEYGVVG